MHLQSPVTSLNSGCLKSGFLRLSQTCTLLFQALRKPWPPEIIVTTERLLPWNSLLSLNRPSGDSFSPGEFNLKLMSLCLDQPCMLQFLSCYGILYSEHTHALVQDSQGTGAMGSGEEFQLQPLQPPRLFRKLLGFLPKSTDCILQSKLQGNDILQLLYKLLSNSKQVYTGSSYPQACFCV